MSLAMGGLLTVFVPSGFTAPAAVLPVVGRGGGLIEPSLLDGRGGGRIDASILGGLMEMLVDVVPYIEVGRGLMLGFLRRLVSAALPGATSLELVGLAGRRVGEMSPAPAELRRAALLSRGAGAAAAARVSMLNPLRNLDSVPLPRPVSTPGFLIERVREGNAVVDMVLWWCQYSKANAHR